MHLGAFAQSECFSILYLQVAWPRSRHDINRIDIDLRSIKNQCNIWDLEICCISRIFKIEKAPLSVNQQMLEGQPTWHFLVYFQKEYWKWCMMEQEVHAWDFMAKRGKVPLLATNKKIYSCNITTLRAKDSLFQLEESRSPERCTQVHF